MRGPAILVTLVLSSCALVHERPEDTGRAHDAFGPDATEADALAVDAFRAIDAPVALDAGTDAYAAPDPLQPRQIAPLSSATVTSQTPTLHWVLARASDGVHVELCRDRALTSSCASFDAVGTHGRPASPLAPGVWFWRLTARSGGVTGTATSPVWELFVGARSAPLDTSFGAVLDVNGDGYADLAMSSDAYPGSGANGAIWMYLGGATGIANSASPSSVISAPTSDDGRFGGSVASVGDVNGDGYSDLVAGELGRAYLYLGGPMGITGRTPSAMLTGSADPTERFGGLIAGVGDLNGDGYADVAVAADAYLQHTGRLYLYLGGPLGLSDARMTPLTGPDGEGRLFGFSVANAVDVNGDGFGDVVCSAWSNGTAGPRFARVYVYLGGAGGIVDGTPPSARVSQPGPPGGFGYSVASAGDVDGNGCSDVVVGGDGHVYLYLGGPGIEDGASASAVLSQPASGSDAFGLTVAGAGDVNGDGYDDIAAGDLDAADQHGRAYVFYGGPSSVATGAAPGTTLDGLVWEENYGWSFARAGDIDADGYDDVVVGAYGGSTDQPGEAYIYRGTPSGTSTTVAARVSSGQAGSRFAFMIARAECVDRDPG